MDIRNFFGKPKAGGGTKKSGASAPSAKKAASSKKSSSSSSSKVAAAAAAPQKKQKEPSKAALPKKEVTINVDDSDTDMEDVAPPKSSSSAAVTKKRKESPSNAAAKTTTKNNKNNNRRKIIIDSDDADSDDDDVDFQPNQNNIDSDDDYKEEPSTKSSAAKKPSKSSQPVKMKQSPKKPVKRSTAKTASAAAKDADDDKPPKFHPPSSQLLEHILNSTNMDVHIQSSLPQLPNNNNNSNGGSSSAFFTSLDTTMTPHCLTGLTFCFTGILSTNDDLTRQTNAQVSVASPSKADYYRNRRYDTAVSNDDLNIHGVGNVELSRDNATDIVKILGGRVTTTVSSKTDYLVAGNILEDGREVVEGSKYKKCLDIWNMFKLKQRQEEEEVEDGSPNKKQKTTTTAAAAKKKKAKSKKKPLDANNLVEVIRGLNEFYALIHFLSEWKKGTLTEEERVELEAQQKLQQQPSDGGEKMKSDVIMAEVKDEKKVEETLSSSIVKKEKSESPAVAVAPASANSSAKPAVNNPYAKPVANPYAKKPAVNPYAKKPVNPYTSTKSSSAASSNNPYGSKKPSAASKPDHHVDSKALGPNALWADKYAPKSSQDILGNKTNVDKLSRWLDRWEGTFNNPKMKVKSLTAPNGPRKAALLSGPPGIGTFLDMLSVGCFLLFLRAALTLSICFFFS